MGFFLDVMVVFLVRALRYRWKVYKGRKWPTADATIVESDVKREYGGYDLHIAFRYTNAQGGSEYADHYIPYWFWGSADKAWKNLRPGTQSCIRANPSDPSLVILDDSNF